jgi:hypothetical protein
MSRKLDVVTLDGEEYDALLEEIERLREQIAEIPALLAAVRKDALEEAAKACEERAAAYVNTKAPGWHEVAHECAQCAAAIRNIEKGTTSG